jgi:hypothetical protein
MKIRSPELKEVSLKSSCNALKRCVVGFLIAKTTRRIHDNIETPSQKRTLNFKFRHLHEKSITRVERGLIRKLIERMKVSICALFNGGRELASTEPEKIAKKKQKTT